MGIWDRLFGGRPTAAPAPAVPPGPEVPPPVFPFPLVAVPGTEALATWRRLRDAWRAEGACPVLLGDREEVERAAEALEANPPPEPVLAAAAGRTAEGFFEARARENRAAFEDEELGPEDRPDLVDGIYVERGEWPGTSRVHRLSAHADILSGKPKPVPVLRGHRGAGHADARQPRELAGGRRRLVLLVGLMAVLR